MKVRYLNESAILRGCLQKIGNYLVGSYAVVRTVCATKRINVSRRVWLELVGSCLLSGSRGIFCFPHVVSIPCHLYEMNDAMDDRISLMAYACRNSVCSLLWDKTLSWHGAVDILRA